MMTSPVSPEAQFRFHPKFCKLTFLDLFLFGQRMVCHSRRVDSDSKASASASQAEIQRLGKDDHLGLPPEHSTTAVGKWDGLSLTEC